MASPKQPLRDQLAAALALVDQAIAAEAPPVVVPPAPTLPLSNIAKVPASVLAPLATPGQALIVHLPGSGGAFILATGQSIITEGDHWSGNGDTTLGHIAGMPVYWHVKNAGGSLQLDIESKYKNASYFEGRSFGYEQPVNLANPFDWRRYDAAITHTQSVYQPDSKRISLNTWSMGAEGLPWALRRGDITCIVMGVPQFRQWGIASWAKSTSYYPSWATLKMPDGQKWTDVMDSVAFVSNPGNDVPPIYWCTGKADTAADNKFSVHVEMHKALKATNRLYAWSWSIGDHTKPSPLWAPDQTQFVLGVGYPTFQDCSLDQDPEAAGSGGVNQGLIFRNAAESANHLSFELKSQNGPCTVSVGFRSKVFTGPMVRQVVSLNDTSWTTINFDAPSSGQGGTDGGVVIVPPVTPAAMTMGGHPLPERAPLAPAGSLEEGAKALNLNHIVTMWHHYNQDRYQRKQWHVTLTREGVWCWNTLLKLGAGDTFSLDFCSANIATGGTRIPFSHPVYALTFNGVELARTTVAAGSNQASFKGALGSLPDDGYRLDIVPLNADGTPGFNVYDQQGNPAGESHVPFWIVVDRNGTAKDLPYAIKQNASWDWAQQVQSKTSGLSLWQKVPKALIGSRAPDLITRVGTPFDTALLASQITRFDQQPANDSDDMDIFMPVKTLRGITTFANLQHYFMEEYINAVPRVPLLDGPRGDCTTSHVLELHAGRAGKWYGCDAWSFWVRYADGSKRTLFGVRHKYPAYWEELDHLGFAHPATEFVGHGDPSLKPDEQYPRASWGMAWLGASTLQDTTAQPIKDAISTLAELPHPGDVICFLTDLRGWVWRLAFNGRDHTVPVEARIFIRCEEPWGVAEVNGVLYVSHLSRISKWDAYTGAYLGDLVKNGLASSIGAHANWQQFVYSPGQDVNSARMQGYLAWEGLRYQDGYLYGGSFAQQQACRIEIASGKIEVCQRIEIKDANNHFLSVAVSDGTFGPRGTIFLSTFTNTYFGRPIAFVPSAGNAADGTPLTHATQWVYHGWEWGPVRGQNKTQAQVYSTASAVGNGMLATTAATLGFDVFMRKETSDRVVDVGACTRGRYAFRTAGDHFRYGANANGFVRLALPLGKNPDVDRYLIDGCGHTG